MGERKARSHHVPPVHAGDVVRARLVELGLNVSDVADRLGMSRAMLHNLLEGESALTPAAALKVERVLGTSAQLLLRIDASYRLHEAADQRRAEEEDLTGWARKFPLGWIQETAEILLEAKLPFETDPVGATLSYFGVDSKKAFDELTPAALPRVTHHVDRDPFALRAWLRAGEIRARQSNLPDYDRSRFKSTLENLPELTQRHPKSADCFQDMQDGFAKAGVYLTLVPEPADTKLNGASFWVTPRKPLIMVTGRLRRADVLWFTVAHEAMHVLHHTKSGEYINLDPTDGTPESTGVPDAGRPEEADADYRAAQLLIGPELERDLLAGPFTETRIKQLASSYAIHPEVLVGRLLHLGRAQYKWKWVHKHLRKFEPDALARQAPNPPTT